jgi:ribosomal protein S18 acetylase RimI-like enzyme
MDTVDVREAEATDAGAFAAFIRRAWAEAGPGAPGFAGATDDAIEDIARHDAFIERITDARQQLFLACDAADVVGFCALRAIDDATVELAGIIVGAGHAGRGIGTMLVERALDAAASHGHRTCVVRTETTNVAARSFYERCGFTDASQGIEVVDGIGIEVCELRRSLGEEPEGDLSRSNPPSAARSVD